MLSRRLIVFAGPEAWGLDSAKSLIAQSGLSDAQLLWCSAQTKQSSSLGQEYCAVIINAYSGLNPDTVGRVSGTIIAGGALILVCPALAEWPEYPDPEKTKIASHPHALSDLNNHYIQRWVNYLISQNEIEIISSNDTNVAPIDAKLNLQTQGKACSEDQRLAVDAIVKVVRGKRRRPAVISADRGRGKSAALGLAAAELIQQQDAKIIIVTSLGYQNALQVFKHANAALLGSEFDPSTKTLSHPNGSIKYCAPDTLLESSLDCDLLLVDEAAALGMHQLRRLLKRYPRIAFSSTEHGYEGSGRGFSLKFSQCLKALARAYTRPVIKTPVRWAQNDPLERWLNDLLLIKASDASSPPVEPLKSSKLSFRELKPAEMAKEEALLETVFQLLVDAHYQTRPVDLRHLLDALNTKILISEYKSKIVGLVWVVLEGGLDSAIAWKVAMGDRRPQGHLAPQIITAHLGLKSAMTLRCARIQRIVVRPEYQGMGIGKSMLERLEKIFAGQTDYLAASFGVDLSMMRFWRRSGYTPVRLSDQANVASGLRSALLLKSITAEGENMIQLAQRGFVAQYLVQLGSSLNSLAPDLALAFANPLIDSNPLSASELNDAAIFAHGKRPFESTLGALQKITKNVLFAWHSDLEAKSKQLMIMRCLQHRTWKECAAEIGLSGKSECLALLREGTKTILAQQYGARHISKLLEQLSD